VARRSPSATVRQVGSLIAVSGAPSWRPPAGELAARGATCGPVGADVVLSFTTAALAAQALDEMLASGALGVDSLPGSPTFHGGSLSSLSGL
jgi:hypothetical protein